MKITSFIQDHAPVAEPGGLYLHHAIGRPAKRNDREFFRRHSAERVALSR